MRLISVVETRDEYYEFEMALAARKVAEEILNIQAEQSVVLTADTQTDMRVVHACAAAIYAAGGVPSILYYHTLPAPQMEPPAPVAAAVAAADIWIEFAVSYIMYTHAWHQALDAGVQYYNLGAMDVDGMVRCVGRQDAKLLAEMGDRLIEMLTEADVHLTTDKGTDLRFNSQGVPVGQFKMLSNPEKIPIMLAGQVSWQPNPKSMQGRLVADGILYPPAEVGVMNETITFEVDEGRITSIAGQREAALLQKWLDNLDDPTMYDIAHVAYGFNPGIKVPTGRIVEDERAFGDFDFGWGAWVGRPAAAHFDFTVRSVNCWINGVQVEENGIFVHPDLAETCRAMGVPGH